MVYPCVYTKIQEEEMTYLSGGSPLDAFNYLLGDWFKDMVLSDIRNSVWNSLQQVSLQPVADTGKKVLGWSIPAQAAYAYGVYRLYEIIKPIWNK